MKRLLALLLIGLPAPLLAETIEIPVGQQGQPSISLPHRGESKSAVLQRYGLADEEHPAVGSPPITRWDYRDFSVYFEYDHVVNSVVHHQPRHPKEQQ